MTIQTDNKIEPRFRDNLRIVIAPGAGFFISGDKMGKRNKIGDRIISSHGYIMIKIYPDRLGASAYEYEHRLVAEKKIGRKLLKGELIHHIDGNKQNNIPENIEVEKSIAHHKVNHRKLNKGRRLPDEENPLMECLCGCGQKFLKYDDNGRPRKFILAGHSKRKLNQETIKNILNLLNQKISKVEIAKRLNIDRNSVYKAMEINNGNK